MAKKPPKLPGTSPKSTPRGVLEEAPRRGARDLFIGVIVGLITGKLGGVWVGVAVGVGASAIALGIEHALWHKRYSAAPRWFRPRIVVAGWCLVAVAAFAIGGVLAFRPGHSLVITHTYFPVFDPNAGFVTMPTVRIPSYANCRMSELAADLPHRAKPYACRGAGQSSTLDPCFFDLQMRPGISCFPVPWGRTGSNGEKFSPLFVYFNNPTIAATSGRGITAVEGKTRPWALDLAGDLKCERAAPNASGWKYLCWSIPKGSLFGLGGESLVGYVLTFPVAPNAPGQPYTVHFSLPNHTETVETKAVAVAWR